MDIGFDHKNMGIERSDRRGGSGRPDWHALRERLLAGRAARLALGDAAQPRATLAWGSFDCSSARLVAAFGKGSAAVNPIASGDGNRGGGNEVPVAGSSTTGDRG